LFGPKPVLSTTPDLLGRGPGLVTGFPRPETARAKTTTMRLILGLDHPTAGHRNHSTAGPYRELSDPTAHRRGAVWMPGRRTPNRSGAQSPALGLRATNRIPANRVDEVGWTWSGLTSVAGRKTRGTLVAGHEPAASASPGHLLGDPAGCCCSTRPVNGLDPEGIRWVRTA